jgi:hypothetical protein
MRKQAAILTVASVIIAGAAASTLYAQDNRQDGMMGHGGMMGMMGMMQQMSQMMDHCNRMMSGHTGDGGRPNDQWRKQAPATPGRND